MQTVLLSKQGTDQGLTMLACFCIGGIRQRNIKIRPRTGVDQADVIPITRPVSAPQLELTKRILLVSLHM